MSWLNSPYWLIILCLGFIVYQKVRRWRNQRQCPSCKRIGLQEISTDIKALKIVESGVLNTGKLSQAHNSHVQVNVTTDVRYRCKHCAHRVQHTELR